MQDCRWAFTGERVSTDVSSAWTVADVPDKAHRDQALLVGPAFFDPQVNGFAGVDFQDPQLSRDQLEFAVHSIQQAGCSHILPTVLTNSAEFLEEQFARLGRLLDESQFLRDAVPGLHLEGPFLSPEKGYPGAHPAEHLILPNYSVFERWQQASGNRIRMITLAPELPESPALMRRLSGENVFVCLGHTNAAVPQLWEAVEAGARLATHLGNGCPSDLPRHDNIVQRILAVPDLLASVIPDGMHVPPAAFANLVASLGGARLVLTTDAVSAAGAGPGTYTVGPLAVEVGADRVVHHPNGDSFAGSGLRMVEGFYNAILYGGMGIPDAWRAWTRLRRMMFPDLKPPLIQLPFVAGESVVLGKNEGRKS